MSFDKRHTFKITNGMALQVMPPIAGGVPVIQLLMAPEIAFRLAGILLDVGAREEISLLDLANINSLAKTLQASADSAKGGNYAHE